MIRDDKRENKNKLYIRPEDVLELILDNINANWKTLKIVEDNIEKMLYYFKVEKFGKLEEEFGFNQ